MDKPGIGFFFVSAELIRSMFKLPDDTTVVGAEWNFPSNAMKIYISSPQIPSVPEGYNPLRLSPVWNKDDTALLFEPGK